MVHQLTIKSFSSLATVGTARSALAKLNLSSGSSDRQTLVDLVGASWREVLAKMEGKTKPEVVEKAAEYGITLRRSDTKVAMIAKFVEVFERDWATLVQNQVSEDSDSEVRSTLLPMESRDEVAPQGEVQVLPTRAGLEETQGGEERPRDQSGSGHLGPDQSRTDQPGSDQLGSDQSRTDQPGLTSQGCTSQVRTSRGLTSRGCTSGRSSRLHGRRPQTRSEIQA